MDDGVENRHGGSRSGGRGGRMIPPSSPVWRAPWMILLMDGLLLQCHRHRTGQYDRNQLGLPSRVGLLEEVAQVKGHRGRRDAHLGGDLLGAPDRKSVV